MAGTKISIMATGGLIIHQASDIITLASMLATSFGKLIQVSVSDKDKYLYTSGAIDDAIAEGMPISDNERYFLNNESISHLPFVVNYKSLSKDLKKLRSSTYFYKDDQGQIEYLMSITINVDEFLYLRTIIDTFVNGDRHATSVDTAKVDQIAKLDMSVHDLIDAVIIEGQKRYGTNVERMTKLEKQSLIREMRTRGVFLIKGAVNEAAKKLNYSETTIYRYLQMLDKDE